MLNLNEANKILTGEVPLIDSPTVLISADQAKIRKDPQHFIGEYLGEQLWSVQEQIMKALLDHDRVLVNSCHGTGKTFIASRIALWWLMAHEDTKIITTGPGFRTVKYAVWKEIASFVEVLKKWMPELTINQTLVEANPQRFILGVSTDKPGLIQGIGHSENTLIIIDEACELPNDMWMGIRSLTATQNAKILAITNPLNQMGHYGMMWKRGGKETKRFTISAFDTPNFKEAGIKHVQDLKKWENTGQKYKWGKLISPKMAKEMLRDCEEDSPDFKARILGVFPSSNVGSLIDLELLDAAFESEGYEQGKGNPLWGGDIAHMGPDQTVLANGEAHNLEEELADITVYGMKAWAKMPLPKTQSIIAAEVPKDDPLALDTIGIGAHMGDNLIDDDYNVELVRFGDPPKGAQAKRFSNIRTAAYFHFNHLLEQGKLHLWHIRHLRDLIFNGVGYADWTFQGGKYQMEPKDKVKKKATGVKGFDHADALVLLCYNTIDGISAVTPEDKESYMSHRRRNVNKKSQFSGVT